MKKILVLLSIAVLFVAGFFTYKFIKVDSFDTCIAETKKFLQSYPMQCRYFGRTFFEEIDIEEQKDTFQFPTQINTEEIYTKYFSLFPSQIPYSGLSEEEVADINTVLSIASLKEDQITEQEKIFSSDVYKKLFIETDRDVGDAPHGRALSMISIKLCLANVLIQGNGVDAVDSCAPSKTRSDTGAVGGWRTDDILALTQIAPYYIAGTRGLILNQDKQQAEVYLSEVIQHYDVAKEQWNRLGDEFYFEKVAGDLYLQMVMDSGAVLNSLGTQKFE